MIITGDEDRGMLLVIVVMFDTGFTITDGAWSNALFGTGTTLTAEKYVANGLPFICTAFEGTSLITLHVIEVSMKSHVNA